MDEANQATTMSQRLHFEFDKLQEKNLTQSQPLVVKDIKVFVENEIISLPHLPPLSTNGQEYLPILSTNEELCQLVTISIRKFIIPTYMLSFMENKLVHERMIKMLTTKCGEGTSW